MQKLNICGRYLFWEDGTPFFYLGDTAWELFHRLTREEIELYIDTRTKQGFTVIQAVALAELEGLTVPNPYGRLPLLMTNGVPDPTRPDTEGEYSYWEHVDYAIRLAKERGLFVALLPTWGDKYNLLWGKGPVIFNAQNAYLYGKWIAERYKDDWNIIWMLGGDRPLQSEEHHRIIDEMARGIREVDQTHLITFHPMGETDSTDYVGNRQYIDFHTSQTGHSVGKSYYSMQVMEKMAKASPKPYMDSEPRYEDHPACFRAELGYYWNADDVRQNAYWNVLSGACGHTYGNHNIWCFNTNPTDYFPFRWQDVLNHPGAEQMKYLKQLRLSRDYASLVPMPDLLVENGYGMGQIVVAGGVDYIYAYSPLGQSFALELGIFPDAKALRAFWFNPRTGEETMFGVIPSHGRFTFVPPTQSKGQDWLLILEAW
ncbi:MAG: glycoside hydrolase family 140 protein [Clostridia bacterium]|nr:glycoside hydrolase family 140 protein [Clostridia bacterium]